ncbi:hypothetical protein NEOLI_004094 [Neolecta irregularis DAH-3]|uniref:Uncharacterized protein n=1 Tax=Neolecta irregularis (strain DAH-3) TaxID=1198029 RepID=A0A1U7LQY7_NEOID|nr:hypothetical protein NEOLI_004094 [Neolecta irregularis DAH-3]|eukprot:OLL25054.1 hypothetical protein NEOLI_004094 [Neolecta irregularis DAH-3]
MLTPFIVLLGIVAASPTLSPPRATGESQSSQIPQRPQKTSLEVTPTAYLDYSSDHENYGSRNNMIEMAQDPVGPPTSSHGHFAGNNNYRSDEDKFNARKAHLRQLEEMLFQEWLASVPSWIDDFWNANLDDTEFQKVKPVIATLWNTIQQFNLPHHLNDYDYNPKHVLVKLVRKSLSEVGIEVSYIEIIGVFTEYVRIGRHFNHGIYNLDLLQHCFAYAFATGKVNPMNPPDQSSDDSDNSDDDLAKFTNEELAIVSKAIEDWQQSSNSNLSQPEKVMSGIIELWRMMASINLHAEYNTSEKYSEKYSELMRRFLSCGRDMGIWMSTDNADEFFKALLHTMNQMDHLDVNLEYFARFFFKELEYRRSELKGYEGSETDE